MNKTLKVVVGLVAAHWLLFTLLKLDEGASSYAMGQSIGKLIWVAIIAFALTRVVKYGWGVAVFVMAAMLVGESMTLFRTLESSGGGVIAPWVLFSIVNVPLLVALLLMLRSESRLPFRERRISGAKENSAP
jgi:hypothetical protein